MKQEIISRIEALRADMRKAGIAATVIPQSDPHQGEYLAAHWQVRRWLSGFTGSAGALVVTLDRAFVWADSRYWIQARQQTEGTGIEVMEEGKPDVPTIADWLASNLHKGDTVGIDGMVMSATAADSLAKTLASHGIALDLTFNPAAGWSDRPALPDAKIFIHDEKYAGESARAKLDKIRDITASAGATSAFISDLAEVAWALNVRSKDVNCNPVATAFLYVAPETATLFIDPVKLTPESLDYLTDNGVSTAHYIEVAKFLDELPADERLLFNPAQTAARLRDIIGQRGCMADSPVALMKSRKNDTQLAGVRAAMIRDGVALVGAFMEIEKRMASDGTLTELDIAEILTRHRAGQALYFDDSFETIAGFGAHGAIVHYSATPESSVKLTPDNLLLVDSGAQYLDGTTDITRTITLGNPTPEQRHDFTLVMKGHIALGSAIFPEGTRGDQLDALARQFLWREGKSYLHGTGHGVGHFLNVHEGPQSIRLNHMPATLQPGMITSNEPGVYLEGRYGIRCENLILTVPAMTTEFGNFYKFETLTLFPFDLRLFEREIMTQNEIDWLNSYHDMVRERLTPHLDAEQAAWLEAKTAKL